MGHVAIERDGSVAVFRFNRPPANAFDLEFAGEIGAAFTTLVASAGIGAVVVTGTGNCFSAGLDLKRVPTYGAEQQRAMVMTINRILAALYACPLPVVGAINGHAIAGGLVFALACDYRVGTSAPCKLGLTEGRAGIPFPAVAMAVVQAETAPAVARMLTLRANNMGPEAALACALLDELQSPERVVPTAIDVARDLASIPRDAYATIKRQLRAKAIAFIESTVAQGTDPALESWLTSDASAASAALLRRRG
jgi:enoyl-CoA hydratase